MLTNTTIFSWNENFDTGLPAVDEQHRKLVDLLNNLASRLPSYFKLRQFYA
jgi:hemerythrin